MAFRDWVFEPVDDRPDYFWPWKKLEIDEAEWEEAEMARQEGHGTPWPFLIGAAIGILLALMMSC